MNALNIDQARFNMIEQQVRPWDVLDDRVLRTLTEVPREEFVPERYRSLAFSDLSIPLDHGQAMMAPKIEGKLLQALAVREGDRVLEIGTGSGYLTACLAHMGGKVHSVDIFESFIQEARPKLETACKGRFTLETRDAAAGWDQAGAFDAIAVTGSLPVLHRGFHEALAVGGRLFVVVGRPPVMQALLITRTADAEWTQQSLFETSLPALVNAEQPDAFRF
jgi:protein-L-isoaspartate(D-aspartate) O-methyltransferase